MTSTIHHKYKKNKKKTKQTLKLSNYKKKKQKKLQIDYHKKMIPQRRTNLLYKLLAHQMKEHCSDTSGNISPPNPTLEDLKEGQKHYDK